MKECQQYFKSRSVYGKLFTKMREKYASLGHFGGRMVLTGLTQEEKMQLGGFLQKDYAGNQTVSLSMAMLQKALESSRFAGSTWEEIIENYFGEPLIVKKEVEQNKIQKRQQYFEKILQNDTGERGRAWFAQMLEDRTPGYQILIQQYNQDPDALKKMLRELFWAVEQLPVFEQKIRRLPVFAANITGNPHFFDDGTTAGRLLLYFIQYYFDAEEIGGSWAEKRSSLLYRAGVLNDDLSNYVLTYGLQGKKRDGLEHRGLNGYYDMKEPVQITLFTLQGLENIWGNEVIYVVENPAVFSVLIEKYPYITALCTNGQLRLSTLLLMDRLSERSVFYYAGDFDSEGLLIAQNLKERYGERLHLWNYEKKYYDKMKSQVVISSQRLKKLENVHLAELQEIKNILKKEKRAGYQENMDWEI